MRQKHRSGVKEVLVRDTNTVSKHVFLCLIIFLVNAATPAPHLFLFLLILMLDVSRQGFSGGAGSSFHLVEDFSTVWSVTWKPFLIPQNQAVLSFPGRGHLVKARARTHLAQQPEHVRSIKNLSLAFSTKVASYSLLLGRAVCFKALGC